MVRKSDWSFWNVTDQAAGQSPLEFLSFQMLSFQRTYESFSLLCQVMQIEESFIFRSSVPLWASGKNTALMKKQAAKTFSFHFKVHKDSTEELSAAPFLTHITCIASHVQSQALPLATAALETMKTQNDNERHSVSKAAQTGLGFFASSYRSFLTFAIQGSVDAPRPNGGTLPYLVHHGLISMINSNSNIHTKMVCSGVMNHPCEALLFHIAGSTQQARLCSGSGRWWQKNKQTNKNEFAGARYHLTSD